MAITGYTFDHLDELSFDDLFQIEQALADELHRDLDPLALARWRSVRREIARRLKPLREMVEGALKPLAKKAP